MSGESGGRERRSVYPIPLEAPADERQGARSHGVSVMYAQAPSTWMAVKSMVDLGLSMPSTSTASLVGSRLVMVGLDRLFCFGNILI